MIKVWFLPPNLAPYQVVIVPIYKGKEEFEIIINFVKKFKKDLHKSRY